MKELFHESALRGWMAEQSMGWERSGYDSAAGHTVAYRLSPARPPSAVVLMVHGAGNDALYSFSGTIRRMLSSGFEVFTFDVDGHGRGSNTQLDPLTVHRAVPRAARETKAAERGLPLHVVGVSFGAVLALDALAGDPDQFASGVLMCPPLRIGVTVAAIAGELRRPLLRAMWRERRHAGLFGTVPSFGPVKRGIYPLRLAVAPGAGTFGYVDVLNSVIDRLRPRTAATRVRVPVLLVHGARDRIVPIDQAEELAALIPGSELLRLEDESHLTAPVAPQATERLVEWVEAHTTGVRA